ncbi:hypothetical protein ISCGN_030866 [Ixodes scapularis]
MDTLLHFEGHHLTCNVCASLTLSAHRYLMHTTMDINSGLERARNEKKIELKEKAGCSFSLLLLVSVCEPTSIPPSQAISPSNRRSSAFLDSLGFLSAGVVCELDATASWMRLRLGCDYDLDTFYLHAMNGFDYHVV